MKDIQRHGESEEESGGSTAVNLQTREIFIVGPIDDSTVANTLPALRYLDRKRGPIHVVLASSGGSEDAGWAIYDAIKVSRNGVLVEAYGCCQSIAALIMQAGALRFLAPDCRFMVHNGSASIGGTTNQMPALVQEIQFLTNRYHEVLAERSTLSLAQVKKLCQGESFMSAQLAVERGFADGVIAPAKRKRR